MSKVRVILCSVFISCAFNVWAADSQKPVIRIVSDVWAPMTGPSLSRNGMSIDFAQQLLAELGYDVEVTFLPWKRIEKIMGTDQFDIIAALWKTPEREQKLRYTQAYEHNQLVFISRDVDRFAFTGKSSFDGLTVGLVSGYAYPQSVFELTGAEFQYVPEARQNILKLARGRIHATVGDYLVMKFEASRHLSPSQKLHFDLEHVLADVPLYMAVTRSRPDHEQLASQIDKLISKFKRDGRYEKLKQFHGL